jgi:hypothetical protein
MLLWWTHRNDGAFLEGCSDLVTIIPSLPLAQALGRSWGGLSTNLHAASLDAQMCASWTLTSGACHDALVFE